MGSRLILNSLCNPGLPRAHRSFCLSLQKVAFQVCANIPTTFYLVSLQGFLNLFPLPGMFSFPISVCVTPNYSLVLKTVIRYTQCTVYHHNHFMAPTSVVLTTLTLWCSPRSELFSFTKLNYTQAPWLSVPHLLPAPGSHCFVIPLSLTTLGTSEKRNGTAFTFL